MSELALTGAHVFFWCNELAQLVNPKVQASLAHAYYISIEGDGCGTLGALLHRY
jgi:hypothetical protein